MNYKLYGIYAGEELVYIGKIKDSAQAMCTEWATHSYYLENQDKSDNYMYEYLNDRYEEGERIYPQILCNVPNADIESVRLSLVYALRPIGNWYEWNWLEEKEERERLNGMGGQIGIGCL